MQLAVISTLALMRLRDRLGKGRDERDRGDVPAWVLITVMTAGIVVLLWGVAGPKLSGMFTTAMEQVTGPGTTK
jgi:hypothetical protein